MSHTLDARGYALRIALLLAKSSGSTGAEKAEVKAADMAVVKAELLANVAEKKAALIEAQNGLESRVHPTKGYLIQQAKLKLRAAQESSEAVAMLFPAADAAQ